MFKLLGRLANILQIFGRTYCKFANFGEILQMSNILLFGQLFKIKKNVSPENKTKKSPGTAHLNIKQNCFKTRYDGSPVGKLKGTMFESLPDVQV